MALNVLATTADKYRSVSVGEASLYALLGFLTVFFGIALLIFIVWLVGKLMVKFEKAKQTKQQKAVQPIVEQVAESLAVADSTNTVDEQTVAVIMAALMAYYQKNNPKCEFVVKRIKRI